MNDLGVDVSQFKIDHIGYQADSREDYSYQVSEIIGTAKQISENIVGGRRVGIFVLNSALEYKSEKIAVIEIFEPREGQKVKSAWEHVEFLAGQILENLVLEYPNLSWDTSALNREEFPMLILPLGDGLRAKFPRRGVLEEVKRISL